MGFSRSGWLIMTGGWKRRRCVGGGNKEALSYSQSQPVNAGIISSPQALTDDDEKKEGVGAAAVVGQTG